LFVDASGNVGVGTASPANILHLQSDAGFFVNLQRTGASPSTCLVGNSGNFLYLSGNGTGIQFLTGATPSERARIDSSGRLGLGTSSPAQQLHVLGSGAAIRVDNSDAGTNVYGDILSVTGGTFRIRSRGGASTHGSVALNTWDGTNDLTRLFVSSAGNVGIGTTSPGARVHGAALAAGGVGVIWDSAAGGSRIEYKDNNNRRGYFLWDTNSLTLAADSGNSIKFSTNAGVTQHATIDGSGRLLVGTSSAATSGDSASAKIQIQANTSAATGDALISLQRGQAAASISSDSPLGKILFADNAGNEYGTIQCRTDGSSGSGDYPGRLVFSVTADGSASPTEALRITNDRYVRLASGSGGIQFNGDTAAANALDDYEEGTWTPDISYSTSNGDRATVTQIARYTKVGRIVHVNINISWIESTSSGNVSITGLPFTSVNVTSNFAIGAASSTGGLTGISGGLLGSIAPNATTIELFYGSTGARVALNETNTVTGGGQFVQLSVSYEAA
jgi:hypothetical protein